MKHRVRTHGKKPKESLKRVKKVAKKQWTVEDLVKAVRHRAWPVVVEALAEGVSPDGVNVLGDPLLMAVTAIAPVRVVAAVLKAKADPNATNRKRETPLFHATDPEVVKRLLKAGADPNASAKSGAAPLHVYAREGRASAMPALLDGGAAIEQRDDEGRTPLLVAVEHARAPEVELLLARGADVRATNKSGEGPLHIAAAQRTKGAIAILEKLLASGAEADARSRAQVTPLMTARTAEAARLLLQAGAKLDAATPEGFTALHLAIQHDEAAVAKVLLDAKPSQSAAALLRASKSPAIRALLK